MADPIDEDLHNLGAPWSCQEQVVDAAASEPQLQALERLLLQVMFPTMFPAAATTTKIVIPQTSTPFIPLKGVFDLLFTKDMSRRIYYKYPTG